MYVYFHQVLKSVREAILLLPTTNTPLRFVLSLNSNTLRCSASVTSDFQKTLLTASCVLGAVIPF